MIMQYFFILFVAISANVAIHSIACFSAGSELITVFEYQKYANAFWDRQTRGYYESGAMLGQTLRDNREAFSRIRFLPRIMRDVSKLDTKTSVLGSSVSFPVGFAPSAMQRLANDIGEIGTARAAEGAGTVMILSTLSTISMEQVAFSAPFGIRWFQLYVFKDRNLTLQLVKRAELAGYSALVVTVDASIAGTRLADIHNSFAIPPYMRYANLQETEYNVSNNSSSSLHERIHENLVDPTLTWKDIGWLKSITTMPIVVKGILTAQDATLAIEHGASAIFVSNHGGRQLDGVPATIDVLSEIVQTVKDRAEVYLDGGIRTGMDVYKALALGARMVFIGRPNLYGLAYGGESGARAVLEILREELKNTMGLIGSTNLKDITPEMVYRDSVCGRNKFSDAAEINFPVNIDF